jgi:hypothetical protein
LKNSFASARNCFVGATVSLPSLRARASAKRRTASIMSAGLSKSVCVMECETVFSCRITPRFCKAWNRVAAPEQERDGQDVANVVCLAFDVLAQFGEHAFRTLQPSLHVHDIDLDAITAVEDQAGLGPIIGHRFHQFVEEGRQLDERAPGRLVVGHDVRTFPVEAEKVIQGARLAFQEDAQLGVVVDVLAVFVDGLDDVSHLQHGTGHPLPGVRYGKVLAAVAVKQLRVLARRRQQEQVARIAIHQPAQILIREGGL